MQGRYESDGASGDWRLDGDLERDPLVVLAHGAGAPYTSDFMEALATSLVERNIAVVRFHFPYMATRVETGSKRPPDRTARLVGSWRAVLNEVRRRRSDPTLPVVLAGKSMGGRMASLLLADDPPAEARAVAYLGYPLHPPGKPDRLRREHLDRIAVPQLFLSGTRDTLATDTLLEETVSSLTNAELYWIPGGDHSFDQLKRQSTPESRAESRTAWVDKLSAFARLWGSH